MARKIILFIFIGLFCTNLFAADKAGYALLDKIIVFFQDMAEKGTGGPKKVEPFLQELMAEVKKSKVQAMIDPVFFKRYTRLLMVLKLAIVEDPEGILGPLIKRESSRFIEDVTGEEFHFEGKGGIGAIADALAEEILNLRLYLDNIERKAKLKEEFQKKFEKKKKK